MSYGRLLCFTSVLLGVNLNVGQTHDELVVMRITVLQ